jgi:hypothetical protein
MAVRDYSLEEMSLIDSQMHLMFARDGAGPSRDSPFHVRFHTSLTSFTIYPRSERDIAVNVLLWRAVHESSFRSCEWADGMVARLSLPSEHITIFAALIPIELVRFLEAVTVEEMHHSVLLMLADAAQGEDSEELEHMRTELAPSVWNRLEALIKDMQGYNHVYRTALEGPRMQGDEGQNTPLSKGNMLGAARHASFMLDQALQKAQEHDYWKIDVQGAAFHAGVALGATQAGNRLARMMRNLYDDWRVYATSCMIAERSTPRRSKILPPTSPIICRSYATTRRIAKRRKGALEAMMTLVHAQRQKETWDSVITTLLCAKRKNNLLGMLPEHVMQQEILPQIIIASHQPKNVSIVDVQWPQVPLLFQTVNVEPDAEWDRPHGAGDTKLLDSTNEDVGQDTAAGAHGISVQQL